MYESAPRRARRTRSGTMVSSWPSCPSWCRLLDRWPGVPVIANGGVVVGDAPFLVGVIDRGGDIDQVADTADGFAAGGHAGRDLQHLLPHVLAHEQLLRYSVGGRVRSGVIECHL